MFPGGLGWTGHIAIEQVQHPWQQGGRGDLARPERSAEAGDTVLLCCDMGAGQRVTQLYWLVEYKRERMTTARQTKHLISNIYCQQKPGEE